MFKLLLALIASLYSCQMSANPLCHGMKSTRKCVECCLNMPHKKMDEIFRNLCKESEKIETLRDRKKFIRIKWVSKIFPELRKYSQDEMFKDWDIYDTTDSPLGETLFNLCKLYKKGINSPFASDAAKCADGCP